jgi:hypothetical protein
MTTALLDHAANPLRYLKYHGSPSGGVFYGVELEVECGTDQREFDAYGYPLQDRPRTRLPYMEKIAAAMGEDFVVFKHDGSLKDHGRGGVEIVTAPASLLVHKRRWGRFFDQATEGLKVSPRCGMHVHVGREGLTREQIGQMLVFVNEPGNERLVTGIAGRTANAYCRKYKKTLADMDNPTERYEALNLTRPFTVELRIFAATLEREVFLARLEFTVALVEWAKEKRAVLSTEEFCAWVREREKRFPMLGRWMGGVLHATGG